MIKGLWQIRNETPEQITANDNVDFYRGIKLTSRLSSAQICAIDDLLATQPDFTVAINDADQLPALLTLRNVRYLQLLFSVGDDPVDLLPALRFPNLRGLRLDAHWMNDCRFIDELPLELEYLELNGETDRIKFGLENLPRFTSLKQLSVTGPFKGYEILAELPQLEVLGLSSIADREHSFLRSLKELRSLTIGSGGLQNLSALAGMPKLGHLSLASMRALVNATAISECEALQWLELCALPKLTALPEMKKSNHLLVILLESMNNLVDFTGVSSAPALEVFGLVSTRKSLVTPANLEFVLKNPTLKHIRAGFGTDRLNTEFDTLASKHGKSWNNPDIHKYRARALSPNP
jgi:hypothetical protein